MKNPVIDRRGDKYWYNDNNELHREDGPALEYISGTKCWYINGKRHRTDGPAVELYNGTKRWYFNDKKHRGDGPAVEYSDGDKEWWYNGVWLGVSWHGYTQEDFERYLRSLKIKEYW